MNEDSSVGTGGMPIRYGFLLAAIGAWVTFWLGHAVGYRLGQEGELRATMQVSSEINEVAGHVCGPDGEPKACGPLQSVIARLELDLDVLEYGRGGLIYTLVASPVAQPYLALTLSDLRESARQ